MKPACTAAIVFAVLATSGLARAQSLPASAKPEAVERYAKGNELFDRAEQTHDPALYEQAYLQFAQAFAIYPDDKVLWNLAMAELATKRYVEALHHLRQYDADQHVLDNPSNPRYAALKASLEEATKSTARLKIDAAAGARIAVDGKVVGTAPLTAPVDVLPGQHTIDATTSDSQQHSTTDAAAGTESAVSFVRPPDVNPAPAPNARPTPADTARATPPAAAPSTKARDILGWTAVGLGVLGVGTGIGFLVDANSKVDALDALKAANPTGCANAASAVCAQAQSLHDGHDTSVTLETAGFIVGGVALAGAAAVWLFWPRSAATATTAWFVPSASRSGLGMTLGGSF